MDHPPSPPDPLPPVQDAVLHHIEAMWQANRQDGRPWSVWVRQHKPLPPAASQARTPVCATWFIDRRGIQPRSPWAYARFHTVHFDQPWCAKMFGEPANPLFGRRRHEIGLAAFARYIDSTELYLEMVWGGLGGQGWRVAVGWDGTVHIRQRLWIA